MTRQTQRMTVSELVPREVDALLARGCPLLMAHKDIMEWLQLGDNKAWDVIKIIREGSEGISSRYPITQVLYAVHSICGV